MGNVKDFLEKNKSNLLIGAGVSGLISTNVFTAKATNKAIHILADYADKNNCNLKDIKLKDKFKMTWKLYLPAFLIGTASVVAVIAGMKINSKKVIALSAAYSLSEAAIGEYQKRMLEKVGPQKAAEINQAVSQSVANNQEIKKQISNSTMVVNDDSECQFYEPWTGRYFKSSWNKLQEAANKLNEQAISGVTGSFSMNDWFVEIGLPTTEGCEDIGFGTPAYDNEHQLLKIKLDSCTTPDNKPCGYIRYINIPTKM